MKLRKKIMLGLWTLMLLAVTFTSTTYAWFKLNSHADVTFDFKVNGGLGFLVSVDNENFSNDITEDKLLMAYYYKTHEGNTEWSNGKLIDSNTKEEINEKTLKDEFSSIQLYPVTSNNGTTFTDLYKSSFGISSKRYLEFDLYLRAASTSKDDNFTYDICLLYDDIEDEYSNKTIEKTSITSNSAYIDLVAGMDTWKKDAIIDKPGALTKQVLVNSSNAMRLSIESFDTIVEPIENEEGLQTGENVDYKPKSQTANIYELTDDNDLGSYATDYSGDNIEDRNVQLYNANYNAMYTYYKNRRPYSNLKPLKYDTKPTTIRNSDLINNEGNRNEKNPVIATVKSGEYSQKLTIRIWQEGWDADCFDGLAESINVRLSFQSFLKKNDNENNN